MLSANGQVQAAEEEQHSLEEAAEGRPQLRVRGLCHLY